MSRADIPALVPLPDISTYSDMVTFGNLGLPVGFDDERVLVNLRAINRVRSIAGLGGVSIIGERGDTSTYDYNVTSMDTSGSATFGAVSKQNKTPLAQGNLTFDSGSSSFGKPEVNIALNTSEAEERIKTQHGLSGLYEAKPRAKYLNSAVKQGLADAVVDANIDKEKFKITARAYGFFAGLGLIGGGGVPRALAVGFIAGPVLTNLNVFRTASMQYPEDAMEIWKEYRQSAFIGMSLDRLVAASGVLKASRIIKAKP
jgi:hypothetical protein